MLGLVSSFACSSTSNTAVSIAFNSLMFDFLINAFELKYNMFRIFQSNCSFVETFPLQMYQQICASFSEFDLKKN